MNLNHLIASVIEYAVRAVKFLFNLVISELNLTSITSIRNESVQSTDDDFVQHKGDLQRLDTNNKDETVNNTYLSSFGNATVSTNGTLMDPTCSKNDDFQFGSKESISSYDSAQETFHSYDVTENGRVQVVQAGAGTVTIQNDNLNTSIFQVSPKTAKVECLKNDEYMGKVNESKNKKKKRNFMMVRFKVKGKTVTVNELHADFVDPLFKLPACSLPKKRYLSVNVTHQRSLTEVHIRLVQKLYTGEYRNMLLMLKSLYGNGQSERYSFTSLPAVGGLYVAYDEATEMWHRVQIIEVPDITKSTSATCLFFDEGYEKKITLSSLRLLLNRKRLLIPPQSTRCLLYGQEKLQKLTTLQKMLFMDKFQQKTNARHSLLCKVKRRPKHQPPSIKLGVNKYSNILKDTLKEVRNLPKCYGCKQLFTVSGMLLERSNEISQMSQCLEQSIERLNTDMHMVRTNTMDLEQGMAMYRENVQRDMQMQFAYLARGLQMALSEYLHTDMTLELPWTHHATPRLSISPIQDKNDEDEISQTWV